MQTIIKKNILFILYLIAGFKTAAQCTFNLGPDKLFCQGQSISATLNGPSAYNAYVWNTGSTSQNITATSAGTYICTATKLSGDLVVNGKFSSGYTGFTSNYTIGTGGSYGQLSYEGTFAVVTNPAMVHSNFSSFGDHTTGSGNMMVCNGSTIANDVVWKQTISVTPNTNYNFSAWVASVMNLVSGSDAAQLQFSINGNLIGPVYYASLTAGQWTNFFVNWNSGSNTSAVIKIVDQNIGSPGSNDFALDDIFFQQICVSKDTLDIKVIPLPNISIATPAVLNCTATSVNLSTSSSTAGITYNWSGPSGFSSSQQNPAVTSPGTYTLIVTEPLNNCTSTETVGVQQNITAPGLVASNTGTLTCTTLNIDLNAASTTTGVVYNWTGPNSFTSSVQNPSNISTPGTYTLIVTDPLNNCATTATTTVQQNINPPTAVTAGNSGTLTCSVTSTALSGNSNTPGAIYNWTGPNTFVSALQNPTGINSPGTYVLTVTNPLNNCTATTTTTVQQNTNPPTAVTANNSGTLTCAVTSINLSAGSATAGVAYSWSGPNGFASPAQNPTGINAPGTYTVTVTDNTNGCSASATVNISANTSLPAVDAGNDQTLPCSAATLNLSGTSATVNAAFHWTGPNSFSSSNSVVTIQSAGIYILTVNDPLNGCSNKDTVIVQAGVPPVAAFTADPGSGYGTLTVNFTNTSSNAGTVSWVFGDGATAGNINTPSNTYTTGTYTALLIASNGTSACNDTARYTVQVYSEAVLVIPNIFSPNGDNINDVFQVVSKSIKELNIIILNRWGQVIATIQDINANWDGNNATDGTYFYMARAIGEDGKKIEKQGSLTLVR